KAALSLLGSLALAVVVVGCEGNDPDGTQQPGGSGGIGGVGGLPTGGTGGGGTGGTGGTGGGTGGTGGIAQPGDCRKDPGQKSCADCLDIAMPACLMQAAGDCPDTLGAFLVCANDNGCMRDNGLPNMDCPPCVQILGTALGCMKSCESIANCL